MTQLQFTSDWAELSAVTTFLIISIAIILRYYKKNCERPKIPLGPILMSLIASSLSGVTLLGKPAEAYAHGIQFVFFVITNYVLNYIVARFVFLPVILKLKTASLYEYFDLRFDSRVRKLVSVPYITMRASMISIAVIPIFKSLGGFQTLGISLAVIPPVIVIHQFSGLKETSLTVALTLLTTFYTSIGGFKGVVWTDTLQGVVMIASMAALTALSVVKVGGFGKVFEIAYETNRLDIPPLSLDPTERITIWSYGLFICGISAMVMNQSVYQRFKSLSSEKEIMKALNGMFLGFTAFALAGCFAGLSIYAYYYGCDPKDSQLVDSYSNVVVFWINEVGQRIKGVRGLYIAGITCASISTMSTHLNTVSDLICAELFEGKPPRYFVPLVTFGIGLLSTVVALIIINTGSLVELSFTFGCFEGIASGLFILGTLFVSANSKGALTGGLLTTILSIITVIGARFSNVRSSDSFTVEIMRTDLCIHEFNSTATLTSIILDERANEGFFLFKVSPFSMGTMATLSTVIVGTIFSLIFPAGSRVMTKSDADLFCPYVHRFLKKQSEIEVDPSNLIILKTI